MDTSLALTESDIGMFSETVDNQTLVGMNPRTCIEGIELLPRGYNKIPELQAL